MLNVAAEAAGGRAGILAGDFCAGDIRLCQRVTGIVAISALFTLRLDLLEEGTALAQVRRHLDGFGTAAWAEALSSLTRRTAELHGLLAVADSDRHHSWRRVAAEDRILAEAVAAAAVGGAASASRVPPQRWLFPFHLFCRLGVSAAGEALGTIERWLGSEFLPGPRTAERAAGLAELVASEAIALPDGCACKKGINIGEVAYTPRGPCRQDDHDLKSWQPGRTKPGSRSGGRYADTLWGWLRRWLGGTDIGRASGGAHPADRPRLRSNDVAGSVLAKRWLSQDRGWRGPVALYDRILPEFCLSCSQKVQLLTVSAVAGQKRIIRATCCGEPRIVYRSEFGQRNGRRHLKPRLGIVVATSTEDAGNAGYTPTTQLGRLWVCSASGRYSLSETHSSGPGLWPALGRRSRAGAPRVGAAAAG